MIRKSTDIASVTFSIRIYQLLLNAYPAKFQQEYGTDMMQVFQDCCLRAARQGGGKGMAKLWAVTLLDILQSVISEHRQKETYMSKSRFIKLSGWALIVGAISFLPGFIGMLFWETRTFDWSTPPMQLAAFAVFLAPIFTAVGLAGLRIRYKVGGAILLFGIVIGLFLVIGGALVQFLTTDSSVSESYYYVWLGGVFVLYVGLSIFGILALIEKPLPRWNWLPLAAGAWLPLLPLLASIMDFSLSLNYTLILTIIIAGLVLMTIAQVMLGYILQADASQEMAPA
jgi:hypothetical protein